MKHIFDMKISPYTGTAEVMLNGQQLSPQSQLRVCAIDHISKWYKDLPELLYSEVNDEYNLKIQCLQIEYIMVAAVFNGRKECLGITYTDTVRKYDTKIRCQWLTEVSQNARINIPEIPRFSMISTSDASVHKTALFNSLDSFTRNICSDRKEQVNVIITTKNTYSEGKNYITSDNDIVFVVDEANTGMSIELGECLAVSTKEKNVVSLIQQWIDITILYPYMVFGHSILTNSGKSLTFYAKARLMMLLQDEPVVNSKMANKLECGLTMPITLDEFPSSNLSVKSSDPSILAVQNGTVKALRTGTANLDIISESGKTVCRHNITVYFVPRVKSITLSIANGNTILEGATFTVIAKYTPSNAVNIPNAKWSFSPNNCLRLVGSGKFEAIKAGPCTITLQVDNIVQSIAIQIMPLAKKIKMAPEIKVKVNASPIPFHASLEPVGSGCNYMNVRVVDTSIAQWNPGTKTIGPINEGDTILEVSAMDAKGKMIIVQNCKVSVLPEKDIITPPTYPTIVVVCAILALITAMTIMSPIIAGCGGVVSILELVQNLGPVLSGNATKRNKIETAIGIAGLLGCVLAIVFYLGLV